MSTFFPANSADAAVAWRCYDGSGYSTPDNEAECARKNFTWKQGEPRERQQTTPNTAFETALNEYACDGLWNSSLAGCLLKTFYFLLHDIPAWVLTQVAYFFNVMMAVTLQSDLFRSGFVAEAWAVVRDLSNLFFIVILFAIAYQLMLGIGGHGGGHGPKQMIAIVVVMALLINFSFFFTGVIIDTSNILALVFYNKLNVEVTVDGRERPYSSVGNEKDISGGLVSAFDPLASLREDFFAEAKKTYNLDGSPGVPREMVPVGTLLAMILVAGLIMGFTIYALFVSALAFVGRLIELWLLIIASPFAFMSFTFPKLSHMKDWGWSAWIGRLFTAAFMAPGFMFFLYFIFLLVTANPFSGMLSGSSGGFSYIAKTAFAESAGGSAAGLMKLLLATVLPMLLIMMLLLKSVKIARAGAGQFGEMAISMGTKLAGLAGGLALGAATGGAALAGTGLIGGMASKVASSEKLKESAAKGGLLSRMTLRAANYGSKASFDVRQTGLGKFAAKKTGMNFDAGLGMLGLDTKSFKDGREGQIKRKAEEEDKKVKMTEMSKGASLRQEERHKQYLEDKKQAEKNVGKFSEADERDFRAAYERGGDMSGYGLDKMVAKGSVASAAEVNKQRRQAYADTMEQRGAVRGFTRDFIGGMKNMVATPQGLAATAAASVIPGVGTAAAIIGGGLLQAFKARILDVTDRNAEVVAMVRKGIKSTKDEALEHLKHAFHEEDHGKEGDHKHDDDHDKEHKDHPKEDHPKDDHPQQGGGNDHDAH